ncbi:hypothetical protein [Georgenia sp. SYP-B2076]|uniref:hypothetical protein n=1 Tax=Georgenia sp. SYP-B2076 TaxID=2495881 RepID=UPI000F8DFC26|nr:hypothetical protein [Georgenia sp. SYP-B2076]
MGRSGRGSRRKGVARGVHGLAAAGLVAAGLAGCTQPGGVTGHLSVAAAQAASASASSALGLELYLAGSTTATVADITLIDMLDEAGRAQDAAAAQAVATPQDQELRTTVSAAIGKAADRIVQARAIVAGAAPRADGAALVEDLRTRADTLSATADRLEAAAG